MTFLTDSFRDTFDNTPKPNMTITEYLEKCRDSDSYYASIHERLLKAIGEPFVVDTANDPRLSRLFSNRKIKIYPAFADFFGMEDVIERLVSHFKYAAQGLEASRNILYLLGPVGAGKSALSERIKQLAEQQPMYVLTFQNEDGVIETSPMYESPLGLFDRDNHGPHITETYGIPAHRLKTIPSPWAVKRLRLVGGDLDRFGVVKLYPSKVEERGITKVEPGDDNNQDVSDLVGTVDIRQLEHFSQNDPDAYLYTGGLNIATQGCLEFVEMFKCNLKVLNPLLTATQEHNYKGTQGFGAMPFEGLILAHSNESEWESFKNDKKNEAFIDRISLIKVPYCMRTDEEVKLYEKLIGNSQLNHAPIAPGTLEMMANFSVLTRLAQPENSNLFSKLRVYNGENIKELDPKAKTLTEYKDMAGVNEGMSGSSTRFAYKILSKVFNYDDAEVAANPIHLMAILERQIREEDMGEDIQDEYLTYITGILAPKYAEFIGNELQGAFINSFDDYAQDMFENYVKYGDHWCQDHDFRDVDTGQMFDRAALNDELEKIEKPAGIANPKDFRNEVVNYVLREKANNGQHPRWDSYEKIKDVIEKRVFSNTEDMLPILSFGAKKDSTQTKKHQEFIDRMMERGYTEKQIRLVSEWWIRYRKHN